MEQSRSQRILWLLEELNLSYELKTFKRGKDMLAGPELKEVHPLGKSPVVSVETPATTKPLVLAESGAIVEFLTEHFGTQLIPKRYEEGKEGQIGGESETWLRYRFFMHYAEGSIMSMLLIALVTSSTFLASHPFINHYYLLYDILNHQATAPHHRSLLAADLSFLHSRYQEFAGSILHSTRDEYGSRQDLFGVPSAQF